MKRRIFCSISYINTQNLNDKNLKSIANKVFLVNSFILATTVYVVCLFDNIFLEILF